nr:hypothetical protein [uncultured Ottowia sp.]
MNPPISPPAKENRQAKKYWLEFEREVIAPPIQRRLAQGAKNGGQEIALSGKAGKIGRMRKKERPENSSFPPAD